MDVLNVVADLSLTSQVEALAAELPPAFCEVRTSAWSRPDYSFGGVAQAG